MNERMFISEDSKAEILLRLKEIDAIAAAAEAENERLRLAIDALRAENERLRAALRECVDSWGRSWDCSRDPGHGLMTEAIIRAAAALKEATA